MFPLTVVSNLYNLGLLFTSLAIITGIFFNSIDESDRFLVRNHVENLFGELQCSCNSSKTLLSSTRELFLAFSSLISNP